MFHVRRIRLRYVLLFVLVAGALGLVGCSADTPRSVDVANNAAAPGPIAPGPIPPSPSSAPDASPAPTGPQQDRDDSAPNGLAYVLPRKNNRAGELVAQLPGNNVQPAVLYWVNARPDRVSVPGDASCGARPQVVAAEVSFKLYGRDGELLSATSSAEPLPPGELKFNDEHGKPVIALPWATHIAGHRPWVHLLLMYFPDENTVLLRGSIHVRPEMVERTVSTSLLVAGHCVKRQLRVVAHARISGFGGFFVGRPWFNPVFFRQAMRQECIAQLPIALARSAEAARELFERCGFKATIATGTNGKASIALIDPDQEAAAKELPRPRM